MRLSKTKGFVTFFVVVFLGLNLLYGENLIPNGELLLEKFSIIPEITSTKAFKVTLIKSVEEIDSLAEEAKINGFCEKLVYIGKKKKNRKHIDHMMGSKSWVKINPLKTYKIKMRVFLPGRNILSFSSYCCDSNNKQLKNKKNIVWGWMLQAKGPMEDFEEFSTTLGPEGSGAKVIFPENIDKLTGIKFRLYNRGNTFYIDAISIAESSIDNAGKGTPEKKTGKKFK